MEKKVWIVIRDRFTSEGQTRVICGVYDNFGDALERVNEVYYEDEENFIEFYEGNFTSDNHNNGFAELQYGTEDYDNISISAVEFEINKPTYDSI